MSGKKVEKFSILIQNVATMQCLTMQTSQICKREFDSHRVFSTCRIAAHLKKTTHFGIVCVQHRGMKISKFGLYIINSEFDPHWVLYTYISIKKCNGMFRLFSTGNIRYPLTEKLALLSVEIQQIFEETRLAKTTIIVLSRIDVCFC